MLLRLLPTLGVDLRQQSLERGQVRVVEFGGEDDGGFEQRTVWHNVVFDEKRQIGAVEWTYDGTHRYHGASWVKVKNRQITHWREYQHVDDREWAEFFGGAASESMIM